MIPDRKGDRWFEKKAIVEALATVPPVVAAGVGALTSLSQREQQRFGWWLLAGAVWLAVANVVKVLHARAQDRERKRSDEYDGFRAALHVLFAAVCCRCGIAEGDRSGGRVRLTLHRVVPRGKGHPPEELEQLLPYLGGPGSPPGRRFSIRSGIIGRAARERASIAATRQNDGYEAFVRELVRNWAYTEEDARSLSADRRAWMAVPILGTRGVLSAVVYLDSTDPAFFTQEVQDLVINCCEGIATYTMEAYG